MTEAIRALAFGSVALALALGRLAVSAVRLDVASPDRLVAELRLAQFAALALVLSSGVYVGLAVAHDATAGTGLDIALAIGFFVVAAIATTCEPTRALTILAVAWGGHGLVGLVHVADILPTAIVPPWYPTAGAIYDVCVAGICYLPILRR